MIAFVFWLSIAFLVYTYIGYPATLAILPKKNSVKYSKEYEPAVTLIIAAYNEEKCIHQKILNSLTLDYPDNKLQIIVAADGSDDNTVLFAQKFAEKGIEVCYQPIRQGKLAAISRAIDHARGEVIVFSDANNMFDDKAIRKLVEPFSSLDVGGVSGAKHILKSNQVLGDSEGLYWKYESFIKIQETAFNSCTGVSGEILAIKKEHFESPSGKLINDDFFLAMQILRKGYRVVYQPDAKSYEQISLTQQDEIIRRTRINTGRYQSIWQARTILPTSKPVLMWQIISHKVFRLFLPFAFIGAFISNFVSILIPPCQGLHSFWSLAYPTNWLFLCIQLLFYVSAWFGTRIKKSDLIGKALYLPTFIVSSNVAALLGFWHFVTRKDQVLWKKVKRSGEDVDVPIK